MYNLLLSFIKNNYLLGQLENIGGEMTHLRSRVNYLSGTAPHSVGCCQAAVLDGEVAAVYGIKGEEWWGGCQCRCPQTDRLA